MTSLYFRRYHESLEVESGRDIKPVNRIKPTFNEGVAWLKDQLQVRVPNQEVDNQGEDDQRENDQREKSSQWKTTAC